jgi:pyruvate kinase
VKTLVTIGPVSESYSSLKKIIKYTNLFRINGSHNTLKWHKIVSNRIRSISSSSKILLDIPGVKPRSLNKNPIKISNNEKLYFSYEKKINNLNEKIIYLSNPIPKFKKTNKYLTLCDGLYSFQILKSSNNLIYAKSLQQFVLHPAKGLNISGSIYSEKLQKKKYLSFLKRATNSKISFDAIGLSFVQNYHLVKFIKLKFKDKIIISKIENISGLKNIDSIIKYSDIIMIDRGDLGAEIGTENLYQAIDMIVSKCKKKAIPVILATENLNSMITDSQPSKSDVVNISHLINLNVDTIMLSDETALSKNFYKIILWLNNFLDKSNKISNKILLDKNKYNKNDTALAHVYNSLPASLNNIPVILFTKKGFFLKNFFNDNKNNTFFIYTSNKKIEKIYDFSSRIEIFYTDKFDNKNLNSFIYKQINLMKKKIFKDFESALLLYTNYPRKGSRANSLTFLSKEDFNN